MLKKETEVVHWSLKGRGIHHANANNNNNRKIGVAILISDEVY